MAVFRVEKTKDYTIMANYHLRDRELSLKAKGLHSLMLSLPPEWDYSLAGLAVICKDGIGSVRSGIAELEERGYLTRQRIRETNGQLGDIEYTILEAPRLLVNKPVENSDPECGEPISGKPICENPTLVEPMYGNCTQSSIKANQELKKSNIDGLNIHQSIRPERDKVVENPIDTIDEMEQYRELIKENIGYDYLREQYKYHGEEIDGILELMLETVCSTKKTVRIGGEDKPAAVVKSRMLKIGQFEIDYVMECLDKNTTEIRNIKAYLLTSLFNAPATIDSYYKARVQHDLYGDK